MINDFNNMDIAKFEKYMIFLSFVFQWSVISMILNLFTMGYFRFELFLIMIVDLITMFFVENKTIKRPSFILSKIWDLIDYINRTGVFYRFNKEEIYYTFKDIQYKIVDFYGSFKSKFTSLNSSITSKVDNHKARSKANEFSQSIGGKVIVEYTSNHKIKSKIFKRRDKLKEFIAKLESDNYKDFSKVNIDLNVADSYIVINENRDLVDYKNNSISLKSDSADYRIVLDGWNRLKKI